MQNNPYTFQEETRNMTINNIFVKMSEYMNKINSAESIIKKIEGCNQLSSYFLINKNMIKYAVPTVWNYNKLIKLIYDKYNEIYDSLPDIIEKYAIPRYKLKLIYPLTREVIIYCKNEIWKYRRYVFKLPLPHDIIRSIYLEWL